MVPMALFDASGPGDGADTDCACGRRRSLVLVRGPAAVRARLLDAGRGAAAATDAIVVLTGGSLRLPSGIALLREGKGDKLFVSGVNQGVNLEDLLRISGKDRDWRPDWALC